MESTSLSCGMSKSNACKNQKQPFANVLQDRCSWFEEVGNFRGFRVFDFSPYTKIENSENSEIFSRRKFQRICFIWGSWEFPRFPSFRFWPLYWNRKLGKLGNFSKTCKFQRMCFTWISRKFPNFWVFDFSPFNEIENSEN